MKPLILATLLLLAPALSGCTASAAPLASAKELEPDAEERALDWAADARLVAIVGIEGEYRGDHRDDVHDDATHEAADDARMDGRLERWMYRYVSDQQNASYLVIMDENGTVVHEGEVAWDGGHAIGDYAVDSDEAIDIARETNQGFAAGLEGDKRGVFLRLHQDEPDENPRWTLIGGSADGEWSAGIVVVDAVTGEVHFELGKA